MSAMTAVVVMLPAMMTLIVVGGIDFNRPDMPYAGRWSYYAGCEKTYRNQNQDKHDVL
jgi:hypothetical protein